MDFCNFSGQLGQVDIFGMPQNISRGCHVTINVRCKNSFKQINYPSPRDMPKVWAIEGNILGRLLPWTGSGYQVRSEVTDVWSLIIRLGVSLGTSVSIYNLSVLAAIVASLYWAWGPIWGAAVSNSSLRLRYPYAGIWEAKLMRVTIPSKTPQVLNHNLLQQIFESRLFSQQSVVLTIGDGNQASFQMEVSLEEVKKAGLKEGVRVHALVLSDLQSLSRFKTIRDVYFPDANAWFSEQPCIDRSSFEYLSRVLIGYHISDKFA